MKSGLTMWDFYLSPYIYSTIVAAHKLGIFEMLAKGECSAEEVRKEASITERSSISLLATLEAMGLATAGKGGYSITKFSEEYFLSESPHSWTSMLDSDYHRPASAQKLVEAARLQSNDETLNHALWAKHIPASRTAELRVLIQAMHAHSVETAKWLSGCIDTKNGLRLLDLGGGMGTFSIEICRRIPDAICYIGELRSVAEIGECLAAAQAPELGDRMIFQEMDIFEPESWVGGCNQVLLSNVLHDWSKEKMKEILSNVRNYLNLGGRLTICEMTLDSSSLCAGLFSMKMLQFTEGRQYFVHEIVESMVDAGFCDIVVQEGPNNYKKIEGDIKQ